MDVASRAVADVTPVVAADADVDPLVKAVSPQSVSPSLSSAVKAASYGKVGSVEAPTIVSPTSVSTPLKVNSSVGKNPSSVKNSTSGNTSPLAAASQPNIGASQDKLFVVTARAADPSMGTVSVITESLNDSPVNASTTTTRGGAVSSKGFPYGTVLTLEARSREGYRFVSWNDGSVFARRSVTVIGNAEYVASFKRVSVAGPTITPPPAVESGAEVSAASVSTDEAEQQKGIFQLLRKWWWAALILALMIHDLKGGK